MCLFIVLTQEGWVDIMHETMAAVHENLAPLVALLFIFQHMYMTWVSSRAYRVVAYHKLLI